MPIGALVALTVAAVATRKPTSRKTTSTIAVSEPDGSNPDSGSMLLGFSGDGGVPDGGAHMQHGTPRRTHRAKARGPQRINVGWKAKVDGPVAAQVTTSPDESMLYVATLGGDLIALSRANGERAWTVKLGDRAYGAPFVAEPEGTIWVGSDAKKVLAITPKGEVVHRLEVDGEADTAPALSSDGTIVLAAGANVFSVRRGGDVAWRFAAKGKVFTAPAILESGLIVFGSQDDHVYALTSAGALAWSTDLGADVDGSPVIGDDGSIYVGTDGAEVVKLDQTGKIVWRTPAGGFVRGGLSIGRNGDVLAGTYGPVPRVIRIGPDGPVKGAFSIQGTGAKEFGIHGGPLEDEDGALYFGTQDDAAYAIDPENGSVRWRFETGADVDAPLTLLSDGSLIVPSEDGSVTLLVP